MHDTLLVSSFMQFFVVYNFQSLEIQLQLPEADKLNDLIRHVESCRSRCVQILKDLDSLKVVPADLFISVLAIDVVLLLKNYYFDRKSNSFLVNGRILLLLFQS